MEVEVSSTSVEVVFFSMVVEVELLVVVVGGAVELLLLLVLVVEVLDTLGGVCDTRPPATS
jgi:hypothetical protein